MHIACLVAAFVASATLHAADALGFPQDSPTPAAAASPVAPAPPIPPPDAATAERIRREIVETFQAGFATKDGQRRRAFIGALLEEAHRPGNSSDERFVLLACVKDEAIALGDYSAFMSATEELGGYVGQDPWAVRREIALDAARNGSTFRTADVIAMLLALAAKDQVSDPGSARRELRQAELLAEQLRDAPEDFKSVTERITESWSRLAASIAVAGDCVRQEPMPTMESRAVASAAMQRRIANFDKLDRPHKLTMIAELEREGTAPENEDAARVEALFTARDLYERMGSVTGVQRVLAEIHDQFEFDLGRARCDAGRRMLAAQRPCMKHEVAQMLLDGVRDTIGSDLRLARESLAVARELLTHFPSINAVRTKLDPIVAELQAAIDGIDGREDLEAEVAARPDDTAAALALGRFLITTRCDWARALPLLARCGAEPWASAAGLEAKAPTSGDDMLAVADAWWLAATQLATDDAARGAVEAHARDWYRRAQPLVTGFRSKKIADRLASETDAAPAGSPAVQAGQRWLARHQAGDGRWDCDDFMARDTRGKPCDGPGSSSHDVGVTALAVTALIECGNSPTEGAFAGAVRGGLGWLARQQQKNGRFGTGESNDYIYDHATATLAMLRACGAGGQQDYRRFAQSGLDYLEQHRNPLAVWRYQPRDNDNDTSVTGWCIMACAAGKRSGLAINDKALTLADAWLAGATDQSGRTGYNRSGDPSARHPGDHMTRFPPDRGEAMTAVALHCRFLLGHGPEEEMSIRQANLLLQKLPEWDEKNGSIDEYYWYHGTMAMRGMGGVWWSKWRTALQRVAIGSQRHDGNAEGSWDPIGVWGEDGGRVYSTAMMSMALAIAARP